MKFATDVLLLIVIVLIVIITPYNKVEESFNTQAIHDISCYFSRNCDLASFDHFSFPGVVPRTFIGPLAISLITAPLSTVLPKYWTYAIARILLGLFLVGSFAYFRKSVHNHFGPRVAFWLGIVILAQPHLPFYMSRTLPNTFALGLVLISWGAFISQQSVLMTVSLTTAVSIFRSEVMLLAIPMLLISMYSTIGAFKKIILSGIVASLCCVMATVAVDSFYWQKFIWPELHVFYYNTVLNKSSNWGVSPFHWYLTSALPKSLLFMFPLGFASIYIDRRILPSFACISFFVFLYSFLPHKELRFIFYAIPICSLMAAITIARIEMNREKKKIYAVLYKFFLLLVVFNSLYCIFFNYVSYYNYPGGHAFRALHKLKSDECSQSKKVHIDVPAAMTGVSRFGEICKNWMYSKEEGDVELTQYDYLVTAKEHVDGFLPIHIEKGYAGVSKHGIVLEPLIYVHELQKKPNVSKYLQ